MQNLICNLSNLIFKHIAAVKSMHGQNWRTLKEIFFIEIRMCATLWHANINKNGRPLHGGKNDAHTQHTCTCYSKS